jgi:hypothetical protein
MRIIRHVLSQSPAWPPLCRRLVIQCRISDAAWPTALHGWYTKFSATGKIVVIETGVNSSLLVAGGTPTPYLPALTLGLRKGKLKAVPIGTALDLSTTTLHKCAAAPRWARISGSWTFVSLNSGLESNKTRREKNHREKVARARTFSAWIL